MRLKSAAPETLSLVIKHDGLPLRMIVDKPKEQSLEMFRKKCKEADCHLVNTEPYSPWQQAPEGGIKETKRVLQIHDFRHVFGGSIAQT